MTRRVRRRPGESDERPVGKHPRAWPLRPRGCRRSGSGHSYPFLNTQAGHGARGATLRPCARSWRTAPRGQRALTLAQVDRRGANGARAPSAPLRPRTAPSPCKAIRWPRPTGPTACSWRRWWTTPSTCSTRAAGSPVGTPARAGSRATRPRRSSASPSPLFFTEEDRRLGRPEAALETARRDGRFEAEGWRVRKDGTRFWALAVLDAVRDRDGTRDRLRQGHPRHDRAPGGAAGPRGKRAALPPAGAGRHRLRHLHARPRGQGRQLERGRAADQGLRRRRRSSASTSPASTPRRTAPPGCRERALEQAERTGRFEAEGWRVRKDGSRFWASVVIHAIRDDEGGDGSGPAPWSASPR